MIAGRDEQPPVWPVPARTARSHSTVPEEWQHCLALWACLMSCPFMSLGASSVFLHTVVHLCFLSNMPSNK